MHRLFLIPLLAACVTSVSAQRFGSAPHFSPRPSPHAPGSRGGYYPVSFFPDFDYGYFDNSGGSQPPVIVFQSPQPAGAVQPYVPAQPLLIELQGGRYVRVSGEEASGSQILDERQSIQAVGEDQSSDLKGGSSSTEVRRTVLVFSDGHREELGRYTISNGILYAEADVYTGGTSSRTMPLVSLNLRETVTENQSRGIRFKLPSAPNEVIVGP